MSFTAVATRFPTEPKMKSYRTLRIPVPTRWTPTFGDLNLLNKFYLLTLTMIHSYSIMRRILSFDIGIKNLAFCVVEISAPPSPVTLHRVVDWGVVNLISAEGNSSQCERPECGNRPNRSLGRGTSKLLFCKNKKCETWATQLWFTKHPKSKAKVAKYTMKKATSFSLVRMAESMKTWLEH